MKAIFGPAVTATLIAALLVGPAPAQEVTSGVKPGFGPMIIGDSPKRPDDAGLLAQAVGDIDGDGRDELVVGLGHYPPQSNQSEKIVILSPDRSGKMSEATKAFVSTPPSFTHPRSIQMKDLNGDGKMDVFVAAHGYDQDPFPGEKNALLMSRKSGKHEVVKKGFPKFSDFTHGAALGNVNGDRYGDVYVGNGNGQSKYSRPFLLLGKKGNKVSLSRQLSDEVLGDDTYYSAAALADLNGDGLDDLILGSNGTGDKNDLQRNVVYFNHGRKQIFRTGKPDVLLPWGRYGGGTNTVDIRTLDVNSDGLTDILMAQHGNVPNFHGYGMQLLVNLGKGKFRDETKKRLGGIIKDEDGKFLNHLMPADFFGDGHPDLVTFGSVGDHAAPVFYINDGSGKFKRYDRSLFMSDDDSYLFHGMALPGDVNGDGLSDIINMSFGTGDFGVATFINQGPVGAAKGPSIVRQPQKKTVARKGQPVRLSVSAKGSRPLSYAWTKNGKPVRGNGPVLEIGKAKKNKAGKYRVTVSNDAGTVSSKTVRLSVK